MPLTLRQSLEKRYSPEQVEKILGILLRHWNGEHSNEFACKQNREKLLEIIKSTELLERIERLYAKENCAYDVAYNTWRLKTDPRWPIFREMARKVAEQLLCPFCDKALIVLRSTCAKCNSCGKVFITNDKP